MHVSSAVAGSSNVQIRLLEITGYVLLCITTQKGLVCCLNFALPILNKHAYINKYSFPPSTSARSLLCKRVMLIAKRMINTRICMSNGKAIVFSPVVNPNFIQGYVINILRCRHAHITCNIYLFLIFNYLLQNICNHLLDSPFTLQLNILFCI